MYIRNSIYRVINKTFKWHDVGELYNVTDFLNCYLQLSRNVYILYDDKCVSNIIKHIDSAPNFRRVGIESDIV